MFERLKQSRVARLAGAVSERHGDDNGGYLAASIAYFGFLSLFPLFLLAMSIVGFVLAGNQDLQGRVSEEIAAAVPGLQGLIGDNLDRVVANRAGAGILGLAGLVWTGAGVVGAARNALRVIFRTERIRGFVRQKLWLVGTTLWLGALALVTTALAAVVGGVRATGPVGITLLIVVPVVTFGLDAVLFLVAYRVLLRRRLPLGRLWPGAVFAAVGWTVLKVGGAWYAARVLGNSSAIYGTFAAGVAVLLVLYLAARLFIYGAELNAALIEETREEVTTWDRQPETEAPPTARPSASPRRRGARPGR